MDREPIRVMYHPSSVDPELAAIEVIELVLNGELVTDESRPRILRYIADRHGV